MKTALVFGSSGLVGNHVLKELVHNSNYSKIKIFVRSLTEVNHTKVEIIKTDFNNLDKHVEDIKGDECFFCIGTTKKKSPDKSEYQKIELDIPKKIAQIAKFNSVKSFFFISSGYANPKSSGDYLKFKGFVEEEIKNLNFDKIGIMRPSKRKKRCSKHRFNESCRFLQKLSIKGKGVKYADENIRRKEAKKAAGA